MIAVSKELKQACNSESLSYKEYIVIDGNTVEIKGKMSNTAYKNTTFFGTFNLKMLEFTTENDVDYKKKIFTYWKSVNGEAFKIGSYIVTDVNDNDSTEEVTVTAMDYGLNFAIPYETNLDYASGTVTLYDVLQECCNNAGVELENLTITNGDFIVDENQFVNGETNGTVVANVAGICGDFATINDNDKLELVFYKKIETIDNVNLITEDGFDLITEDGAYLIVVDDMEEVDDYISLDDKRDTQPITCVSLGFSNIDGEEIIRKDNDLIALYGENWLRIDDNYFAYSTAKMDLLIDNIFNKVKGFGYSSFVSKYSFKPYLQLGDMIYFKNKNGDKIRSVVFKIDTDYDDITLSAPSITKATVDYERPDDALTVAKNAQISVDKANAQIELKVNADDVISAINLSPEEITIQSDKIKLEGYTTINDGFSIDLQGNSITNGMTANEIKVIGGNISLEDTGDTSDPTIEIYDGTTLTNGFLNVGDTLSGKTLIINFPNTGETIDNLSSGGTWHNTVTTNNGNYIQNYHKSLTGYEEVVKVVYKGTETYLYFMFDHNIDINETTYTLPNDFGTITAIDTPNAIPQYININNIPKKTTKFKSSGISIIDEDNEINTIYGSNGLSITDTYGNKYFNEHGLSYSTNYGSDYAEFSANKDALIYISHGTVSSMIMDCVSENAINDSFEIKLNNTSQLLLNRYGAFVTTLTQTSKEEAKKNFEKLDNALDIIKDIDIYKYHMKEQNEKDKKHIGFVIGDNFNYSKEITSNNNEGVDLYSMVSVCMKAIKEQQEQIEKLKEEISQLKRSDK